MSLTSGDVLEILHAMCMIIVLQLYALMFAEVF